MDINAYKPKGSIQNRHLLTLMDYTPSEIFEVLHTAKNLKRSLKAGEHITELKHKTLAMSFA